MGGIAIGIVIAIVALLIFDRYAGSTKVYKRKEKHLVDRLKNRDQEQEDRLRTYLMSTHPNSSEEEISFIIDNILEDDRCFQVSDA